jgi:hypothetical protein
MGQGDPGGQHQAGVGRPPSPTFRNVRCANGGNHQDCTDVRYAAAFGGKADISLGRRFQQIN